MDGLAGFWAQSDAVGRAVAALLLLMSIGAWVVILWKVWVLRRARRGLAEGIAAFWEAPDLAQARERAAALDPEGLLRPLIDAAAASAPAGTLQDRANVGDQLTRRLRDALHRALAHLQTGQVFLASVGSTSPFIGLFGTVWGIYHALLGLGTGGAISIERIAGPVGEALVMTAAGLAVAIPAVLAYNLFGKWVGACEAELEGFAHDLRGLALAS
ncbi:MotA/TolQ/ExbB proton channel family protein [Ideonella sp. 4Y11]|uniref:Biopolymer transport protein ExbB n=1 Tax=Ideonella aquatica TaxID=2824119 RepID=A0A941BJP7_9BURK|nr:MotA/TolQ/ExbB proton channel family protein [Ideonella aquatica]MBQ0959098.1 MotA/TolQ/ExbB proton channel family protein [Ideonella aquatica]